MAKIASFPTPVAQTEVQIEREKETVLEAALYLLRQRTFLVKALVFMAGNAACTLVWWLLVN